MTDIGEDFREARIASSVSLEEASNDTGIPLMALNQIEEGSIGSFKDIFELKEYLRTYAKYLGFDPEKIIKEFNEFMFEYTSKIPAIKLEKEIVAKEKQDAYEESMTQEIKVVSPYLKSKQKSEAPKYILIAIVIILLIAITLIWAIKQVEG